ncbi:MAG: redoxin domain-containing protein [Armatimonadetes bacterium]|nr:redoxin domain-containing protein [Armatimonadota bacterium]
MSLYNRHAGFITGWAKTIAGGAGLALLLGSTPAFAADSSPAVSLQPITAKGIQQEIKQSKGKLVLVSLWSRSCPPCIAGYPELVQMGKKYGPKGLRILSINVIDDERTRRDWSIPFLQKQNLPAESFDVYYENEPDDESFIKALDAKWYGGLPAEFLFNTQGKRLASMTEEVDMAKLEKLIVQRLEGTSGAKTDAAVAELREYIERKGGVLTWDPSTRTIRATVGDRSLVLKPGSRSAQVGSRTVRLDRPVSIEEGRTMVPRSLLDSAFKETG